MEAGVPQGPVLPPTLCNVLFNDVLEFALERQGKSIAFADLMRIAKTYVKRINMCMQAIKLKLASEKTKALIATSKKKQEDLSFKIDNVNITPKKRA